MKIWDRLQPKFVRIPSTSKEAIPAALLGQWQVKSDNDGTKLNGIHVQKNTCNYLVPDATKRLTLQDSKATLTSKFPAWQIPVDSDAYSLVFFCKRTSTNACQAKYLAKLDKRNFSSFYSYA